MLAAELVRRQVAAIAAIEGAPVVFAVKAATSTIPIVFTVSEDPVRLGLVAGLARPGGNITGINFFSGELFAKRLELLREAGARSHWRAVLVNPSGPNAKTTLKDVDAAARAMGLQIQVLNASTAGRSMRRLQLLCANEPRHFSSAGDPFFSSRLFQLLQLAARHAIPAT